MAKEFFKDLPNTTTPLSSARLNGLLDGGEPMGNIAVDSIRSKNMIKGWFIGGLLSTTGAEDNMSTSRRTGFIEVDYTKVSTYKVSGMPEATTGIRHFICAYNANKQFLGRTGGNTGTHENLTSTVYTNGTAQGTGAIKYLRVNLYSGADDSSTATVQLEEGGNSTTFYEGKGYGSIFGSNANGYYQKFDDGTLICWNRITVSSVPITSAMGSLYVSGNLTYFGNFPISFIDTPITTIISESDDNYVYCWAFKSVRPSATEIRGFRVVSYQSVTLTNLRVSYIAIGRWK